MADGIKYFDLFIILIKITTFTKILSLVNFKQNFLYSEINTVIPV